MMAGLPGSGKSTFSLALGHALGWPVVDKDILEGVLRDAGITLPAPTPLAYDLAFALLYDLLVAQRRSAILDCPNANPAHIVQATQLVETAGGRLCVVLCLSPQAVRNERMTRVVPESSREWRHPVRRTPSDAIGDGRERFTHLPDDTLLIDTTLPQAELIGLVAAAVLS